MKANYWLVIVLAIALLSCKKEDDTIPVVESITFIDAVNDTHEVYLNDTLKIQFSASDNAALSEYRLSLYNNFSFNAAPKANEVLSHYEIGEFTGSQFEVGTAQKTIEDSALAGLYYATLQVIDAEKNSSEISTRFWRIRRFDEPDLTIVSPDLGSDLIYSSSDTLKIEGSVSDNESISSIQIRIAHFDDLSFVQSKSVSFPSGTTSENLIDDYKLEMKLSEIEAGNYWCFVVVKDNLGNTNFLQAKLTINA